MVNVSNGLYNKFTVTRNDGDLYHNNCSYFVLDLTHDVAARKPLLKYGRMIRHQNPNLYHDILRKLNEYLGI